MKGINIFFVIMLMCVLGIAMLSTMQGLDYLSQDSDYPNNDTEEISKNNPPEDFVLEGQLESSPTNNSDVEPDTPITPLERNDGNMQFCGISTYTPCESDEECIITGCLNQVCQNRNEEYEIGSECEPKDCFNSEKYGYYCKCFNSVCKWG